MADFASDSDSPPLLQNRAFGAWPLTRQAKGSRVLVLSSTMVHIKGLGGGKAAAVCARLLCLIQLCGLGLVVAVVVVVVVVGGSRVSTGGASRFAAAPTQRAAPHKSNAR